MKKLTKQEQLKQWIDERHKIYLKLMKGMGDGIDMSTTEYAKLNDRYHWLNDKIIKAQKKKGA